MDKRINKNDAEHLDFDKINNLDKLKIFLSSKYPDLQKHFDKEILRFAVNQEYVVENIDLYEDDEIALFPPVSGG